MLLIATASAVVLVACGSAGTEARTHSEAISEAVEARKRFFSEHPPVVLARGGLPDGGRFVIEAGRCQPAEFHGCYELAHHFEGPTGYPADYHQARLETSTSESNLDFGPGHEWGGGSVAVEWGCVGSYRVMFLYGIIGQKKGEAIVRTATRAAALHKVAIPRSMEPHGALVYGVFEQTPFTLLVKTGSGDVRSRAEYSQFAARARCRRAPDRGEAR